MDKKNKKKLLNKEAIIKVKSEKSTPNEAQSAINDSPPIKLYPLPYTGIYMNPLIEQHVKDNTQMCIVWSIEELGELIQVIIKKLRGQKKNGDLAEEIADVLLAIEQVRMACGISTDEIQRLIDMKIDRMLYRTEMNTLWHRNKDDQFKLIKKLAVAQVESTSDVTLTELRKKEKNGHITK